MGSYLNRRVADGFYKGNGQSPGAWSRAVAEPPRRAELRDYFGSDGLARLTVLADWEGDPSSQTMGYRVGDRIIRANNDMINAITGIPGQFRENWRLLSDPRQRKLLARSLVDDSLLTHQRRKAIFSILLWTSLAVWAVVGLVLAIVNREALADFQSGYALFFYSLATSLFLPTPFEIILQNAVDNIGVFATVAIASSAKVVGAWLVLMMGDKANQGLSEVLERRATLRKMFEALERFAQRFGYLAVFILFAIPFMSDTAPLFILAVLKMRKSLFLAVTFIAIVVRSLLFIYAGDLFGSLF